MRMFVTVGEIESSLILTPGVDPIDRVSYLFIPNIFYALPHGSAPCSAIIRHN